MDKDTHAGRLRKDAADYDRAFQDKPTWQKARRALVEIKGRYPLAHLPDGPKVSEWIRDYAEKA